MDDIKIQDQGATSENEGNNDMIASCSWIKDLTNILIRSKLDSVIVLRCFGMISARGGQGGGGEAAVQKQEEKSSSKELTTTREPRHFNDSF